MPILKVKRYTRAEIRANPEKLYVFGDNLERWGMGGQAKEARGEPNAVGIPTKVSPYAYMNDDLMEQVRPIIWQSCLVLEAHLEKGGTVVIPEDGIGTGLARMPVMAPKIFKYIEQCFERLTILDGGWD